MIEALRKVIKRMHYPLEVMLTCVRWYVAYPLSLRNIEEMMAERAVIVDHATGCWREVAGVKAGHVKVLKEDREPGERWKSLNRDW